MAVACIVNVVVLMMMKRDTSDLAICLSISIRRYFSRLWCTYEISTFLRHLDDKQVAVMPVSLAMLLAVLIILNQALAVLDMFMNPDQPVTLALMLGVWALLGIPAYTVMIYVGIGIMRDVHSLTHQL